MVSLLLSVRIGKLGIWVTALLSTVALTVRQSLFELSASSPDMAGRLDGVQPISWAKRIEIAIGVARGLSFLHSLDANVIYRDLKASNILLDLDYNAKLSDFGLARDGPTGDNTHVSTKVVGTQGYAAPEYVATELLSGRRAMDDERGWFVEETLVDWAKPFLGDSRRVLRIMDTRLGGQYSKKGAQAVAAVASQCLRTDPKNRPTMVYALATLERIRTSNDAPKTSHTKLYHNVIKHTNDQPH